MSRSSPIQPQLIFSFHWSFKHTFFISRKVFVSMWVNGRNDFKFCNMWSSIKQPWRCFYAGKNVEENNILQAFQVSLFFFAVQLCKCAITLSNQITICFYLIHLVNDHRWYKIVILFSVISNKTWDDMRVLMVTFHLVCNVPRHGHKPNSLLNNFNWYKDTDGEETTMGRTNVLSNVM